MPKYYEFRDLQIQLGKTEAEYNGKFAYYSEISKIFRELEDRKETLDKIDNAIPPKSQLADLIYFFQQKGTESGLIIKNISLTKISPVTSDSNISDSNIKETVFSLDALGNYQSLKNFLYLLENSSRLFKVGNISFGIQVVSSASSPQNQPPVSKIPIIQPPIQQIYYFKLEIKTHSY